MPDRFRLDGKAAVITGASSGLGRAFALALAEAGADVALGARREQQLAETVALVERTGRRAIAVRTDVAQPSDCERLADRTYAEYGRLDILVNNAGVGSVIPALKETRDQFQKVVDVNLTGAFTMAQVCARRMENGGAIINVGSVLGFTTVWARRQPTAQARPPSWDSPVTSRCNGVAVGGSASTCSRPASFLPR